MAGLDLIGMYTSDSDDEEETKKSEETGVQLYTLPLPDNIASWTGNQYNDEVIDEPEIHGGRIRSFNHERGNWPTLIYIDYEPSPALTTWITSINKIIKNSTSIDEKCHISLSRTLILKYHWIDSFVNSLKKLCNSTKKFNLQLNDLRIYCNENKSRTFLGIRCENQDHILEVFMESLNKLLSDYQLPPFYEEASYHISLLWLLGDKQREIKQLLPSFNESLHETLSHDLETYNMTVSQIHCKIGNKLYEFSLK